MRWLPLCSVALAMGIWGCRERAAAPGVSATRPAGASKSLRYLALGDSYTIGESVDAADRWPVQLAVGLRARGVDVGEPEIIARTGWTTDELSSAIDRADPRGPYDLVTLLIGVNNQFRGRAVEEFRQQFVTLVRRATGLAGDRPARVVVVSIPDWGATPFGASYDRARVAREIDAFNAVCREEANRAGVAFVDITPGSRTVPQHPDLVARDGLHPSSELYKQWTEAVLPVALRALGR